MPKNSFDPGLTTTYSGRLSRTINAEGTFNVHRSGGGWRDSGGYLALMSMSWPRFLLLTGVLYLAVNVGFALVYLALGVEGLSGAVRGTPADAFLTAFFFSVQTFTTVGYGHIAPQGVAVSFVAAIEAMSGWLCFALATGLLYGRFARPSANLAFSEKALVAPFNEGKGLMLRIANRRRNVLMELEATLLMMTVEQADGALKRRYQRLDLELPRINFLPLTWTLVHPINESSPLWGRTAADLEQLQAELLVLVRAFDDSFSQTVHGRHSYPHEEIEWNARFLPAFSTTGDGAMRLELDRLSDFTPAE